MRAPPLLPLSLFAFSLGCGEVQPSQRESGLIPGNPTCADLGFDSFFTKIDPPDPGTYPLAGDGSVTFTSADGIYFDWTSTIPVDAVIVKGGPNASLYLYDPEASSGTGLSPPINPNTGIPYEISHIDFCYDYELSVTKTATTSLKRRYEWTIEKTGPTSELVLAAGQILSVEYQVVVALSGWVDSHWAVGGVITVHNPAPVAATVEAVTDILNGTVIPVSCGVTFPYVLGPSATLVCSYSKGLPSSDCGQNRVEVDTSGPVGAGEASAAVDFAGASIHEIDAYAHVTDDHAGHLGAAHAAHAPKTFTYWTNVGPYGSCGDTTFVNRAELVTSDTGATASSEWTVPVKVPCEGCTLTPGYWKTHSSYGPAPYDDAWALLPDGADTVFNVPTGLSYYQALWTPPGGNAYYILAHAYIAAQLNALNGAALGAAEEAFDAATKLFLQYSPADIAALKGRMQTTVRSEFIQLAEILDAYNNGRIGPGHCSE